MPGKLAVLGGLNLCGEQQFPFFKYNEFGIFDVALFKKLSVVGDGHCTVCYNCYVHTPFLVGFKRLDSNQPKPQSASGASFTWPLSCTSFVTRTIAIDLYLRSE